MSTSEDANMLETLNSFYKADSASLRAGGGDFTASAATLDPECVIYQPVLLPYGGDGVDTAALKNGCGRLLKSGVLWRLESRSRCCRETS